MATDKINKPISAFVESMLSSAIYRPSLGNGSNQLIVTRYTLSIYPSKSADLKYFRGTAST